MIDSRINQRKFYSPFITLIKHPINSVRQLLDPLVQLYRYCSDFKVVNLKKDFPMFAPASAGKSRAIKKFTKNEINGVFDSIGRLMQINPDNYNLRKIVVEEYLSQKNFKGSDTNSATIFKQFGTNKPLPLHKIYDYISSKDIKNMLEIGIGSVNPNIVSHMPETIMPGSSLRSFREIFRNAIIHGADYDREILIDSERIVTEFVDQLSVESISHLFLGKTFDLIIDDGFHSPRANLNVILFSLERLQEHGILIIEDVSPETYPLWKVVSNLIKPRFNFFFVQDQDYCFIIIERLA